VSRLRRLVAGVGLAAGGWLALAGPAAAGPADVVVVGDSILTLSMDELDPKLTLFGWVPHLDGQNGSGLSVGNLTTNNPYEWTTALAEAELAYDPEVVVIVLGTNDATWVYGGEPYVPHIERLLLTTDAPRVYWATCSTHTAVLERNEGCRLINADLAAHQREGFGLIDYDALSAQPGATCYDSVHTCPDDPTTPKVDGGQEWFARLIADTVGVRPK
jgi:lysophospholipase L1-like esterase